MAPGRVTRRELIQRGAVLFVAGPASLATMLEACSSSGTQPAAPSKDTVRFALSSMLETFDPRISQPAAKVHLDLMYDHIVGTNATETDVSKATGIAKDWSTTDNITWHFKLRDNFKFHNGQPLTASDAQYSIQRLLDPKAAAAYTTWFKSSIAQVTAPSPTDLTIVLKGPSFDLPLYLSSLMGNEASVVPMAYVQQVGDAQFNQHPIGSGAYKLTAYTSGVSMRYDWTGQPHPTLGRPRYKTVQFSIVASDPTRVNLLQTGAADIMDVGDFSELHTLKAPKFRIQGKPGSYIVGVSLNEQWLESSPLHNESIRKALALAINAKEINTALLDGRGKLTGVFPVGSQAIGYKALTPYPYDPAQAKSLLKSANYDGAPINLYSFAIPALPGATRVAEAIQQNWTAIGVKVNLVQTQQQIYISKWVNYTLGSAAAPNAIANRPLASSVYNGQFSSKGSSTYTKDPVLDGMINGLNAAEAVSKEQFASETQRVNQYVHDHYLSIPIVELGSFYAVSSSVKQWNLGGGQYDINVRELVAGSAGS